MLAAAAFTIDLAQIHLAQRDLQNMSNLAALDVAQAAGGCLAPDLDRQAVANAQALASLGRHGGDSSWLVGGKVQLGRITVTPEGLRDFQVSTEEQAREAYAFSLELQRAFPALLMPMPNFDVTTAVMTSRSASVMAPNASFSVASFVASIGDSEVEIINALFEALLGSSPAINVLGGQGMAQSSVQLSDMANQLGLTSLDQLLTQPITLGSVLGAMADALFASGAAAAAAAVDAVAAVAPNEQVVLGEVLGMPDGLARGVGEVGIGTLALARTLAFAVGEPVFALVMDGISVPGIVNLGASASVVQIPEQGAGPAVQDSSSNYLTTANNTQGEIGLDADLLPVLGYPVNLNLRLELADATAKLRDIRCANRTRLQHEVELGVETALGRVVIDNPPSDPLVDLGVTAICWEGSVNIADPEDEILSFVGPFDPDDSAVLAGNTQTVGSVIGGSLATALGDLVINSPPYICGPVGPLIDPIVAPVLSSLNGTLGPLLSGFADPLITPLLAALGANIGGADVTVHDVYMAPPALIRTSQ